MQHKPSLILLLTWLVLAAPGESQVNGSIHNLPLVVPAGTPLRVYLTKRLSKRLGEPVEAKLLDPLYAFDREVAPAGSQVLGTVIRLQAVSKMQRTAAILGGDFTPLHQAEVEFDTLILPDGRRVALHTSETPGLNSLADLHPKKRSAAANQRAGVLGTAKAQIHDKIDSTRASVSDMVHGPGKKDRLEDYVYKKLPYHPQSVRRGTRFDPELMESLQFGTASIEADDVVLVGSQPPLDSVVIARLVTQLNSRSSKQGEAVDAVVSQPLFSSSHKLLLPEGTHLSGVVTSAQPARMFRRGGQLRFVFQTIELPDTLEQSGLLTVSPTIRTLAVLQAAEPDGKGSDPVDQEGGVKATASKTRFIAPAIAFFVANRSADNDVNKRTGRADANTGGRVLGGASGFGLLGSAAAKASPNVASALGFYGLAWSVYWNIIARGREVDFQKDAGVDVRFGARVLAPGSKFRGRVSSTDHVSEPQ